MSSGEVANCRIADTRERISKAGLANSSVKIYPRGSVLIAMIGEGKTRGQSAILDIEAATNQNAAGLLFDAGNVSPESSGDGRLASMRGTETRGAAEISPR